MGQIKKYRNLLLIVAAFGLLVLYTFLREPTTTYTKFDPPRPVSDQTFYTTKGNITTADLRGKVSVIYIGYTNCPDFCPTTLGDLKQTMKALGKRSDDVNVLFITVDPKRDTLDKLSSYIAVFDTRFFGAQMSAEDLPVFTRELGLTYVLGEPGETGYYSVEHSTHMMILDREANLVGFWRYGSLPGDMASDLKALLR